MYIYIIRFDNLPGYRYSEHEEEFAELMKSPLTRQLLFRRVFETPGFQIEVGEYEKRIIGTIIGPLKSDNGPHGEQSDDEESGEVKACLSAIKFNQIQHNMYANHTSRSFYTVNPNYKNNVQIEVTEEVVRNKKVKII